MKNYKTQQIQPRKRETTFVVFFIVVESFSFPKYLMFDNFYD